MDIDVPARIGQGKPCYVIAEAGVNHNGDPALAHALVDAAHAAGADAVKFQAFVTEELVTARAAKAAYQTVTTGGGTQFAMLKALELDGARHAELKTHCESLGLAYLCTPYDDPSAAMLDRLGVAAYKVASTDTDNIPFLRTLAATGRPVILSTGMATLGELEASVDALRCGGCPWLALLHCTAEYPAPAADSNLRAMETLRRAFALPVGFSDHTEGMAVAPLAVALGAVIIEKHFTLDRAMAGPDHRASCDPAGLAALVAAVRQAEAALGDGIKRPAPSEAGNKARMRKSLVARRDIAAGTEITAAHLTCKRPADGLEPQWFDRVLGRRAARDIAADEQIGLDAVVWR
jgi:N-acetylneuraminate synthase